MVLALAALKRQDVGPVGNGGQGVDRLFAPFRDRALVAKADAQSEQFAGIRRGCAALRKALVQNAFIAGETIAVVLQSRHQVVAQRFDVDAVRV